MPNDPGAAVLQSPTPARRPLKHFHYCLAIGLPPCALTSLIVVLGVLFGRLFVVPPEYAVSPSAADLLSSFSGWDGVWYQKIATEGYAYDPTRRSSVAFFPAYPVLGRLVGDLTGWRPDAALLLVSHVCLAAAFVFLAGYVHLRFTEAPGGLGGNILLAAGLMPTTLFFRMAYTESLFLLLCVMTLYGMERRWPALALALVVGLATGTRPVGVALVPVLALHLWRESSSWRGGALRLTVLLPVACWGIFAYMFYLQAEFGDPLAFAQTQSNWRMRGHVPVIERAVELLTFEPVFAVYDRSSPCFWGRYESAGHALFSLQAANPICFLLTVALVLLGGWNRWLSATELLLAAGLLSIPYLTRSHEMCFLGMGRFCGVVFPAYFVLGRLLTGIPPWLTTALLGVSAFFLGSYAALFAAGYRVV